MSNYLQKQIGRLFSASPDMLFGYADASYSPLSTEYKSALVFAVPYGKQLALADYTEAEFEEGIQAAKTMLEAKITEIEAVLKENEVKYYIPPVAQKNETDLLAEFSFKFAAVNAGLGWIGKNDVLITERYGPRVRLSAVLIDHEFPCGTPVTESKCGDCHLCVDVCPYKALSGETWNINSRRNDIIDYQLCNEKRSFFIQKLGRKSSCGLCLVVCPYGTE